MKCICTEKKAAMACIVLLFCITSGPSAAAQEKRTITIAKPPQTMRSASGTTTVIPKPAQPAPARDQQAARTATPSKAMPAKDKDLFAKNLRIIQGMKAFVGTSPALKEVVAHIVAKFASKQRDFSDFVALPAYRMIVRNMDPSGLNEIKAAFGRVKGSNYKTALVTLLAGAAANPEIAPEAQKKIIQVLRELSLKSYMPGDSYQFVALVGLSHLVDKGTFQQVSSTFFSTHRKDAHYALESMLYKKTLQKMLQPAKVKTLDTRKVKPVQRVR